MKIAIDALPLLAHGGHNSYVYYLLKYILRIDKENIYNLFFRTINDIILPKEIISAPNINVYRIFIPNRVLEYFWTYNNIHLPFTKHLFKNCDIFFSTMFFVPVIKDRIVVSVVHDIAPIHLEDSETSKRRFDLRIRNIINRSRYLITVSKYVKEDLCTHYNVSQEKIVTIPLAADNSIFHVINNKEEIESVKRKYNIDSEYILYVGNISPLKNLFRVVSVFKKLKKHYKIPHKLVLCGKKHWGKEIIKTICKLELQQEVLILDYISHKDLPLLYNGADLFIFISLYEGFGLPLIEAMSCGLPVITSNVTAMPEVVGDAGILVNPYDEEEILNSIIKVLTDENLRKELKTKALNRAKLFSWENTARQTLEVFKKAIQ